MSASAELILNELIRSIALEGLIPEGSVLDAGTNNGADTCEFAAFMPSRTIHGLDPLQRNIASLKRRCGSNPNIRPLLGGLGAVEQTLRVPLSKSRREGQQISIASHTSGESPIGKGTRDSVAVLNVIGSNKTSGERGQEFDVWSVDQLFATQWRDERLGFAHWDTEGNELDILRGAVGTLRRDAPIFTVECVVHKAPQYTAALLAFISSLDYDSYLIEEEAGAPLDTRNILNLPRRYRGSMTAGGVHKGSRTLIQGSPTLKRCAAWHTGARERHDHL